MKKKYEIKEKVWLWSAETAAWYFVSIPKNISKEIKENFGKKSRGFGSLRVKAEIGKTTWETSIFPDKRSGMYLLPLKAEVRRKEEVFEDEVIEFTLEIL